MIITIDGPMCSGKSTIARFLAQRLGYYYINSGLLFRALAYLLIHECGYTEQQLQQPKTDDITYCLNPALLQYTYDEQEHVFFKGQEITSRLYSKELDQLTSLMSMHPEVRQVLMQVQRTIAKYHDCVVEGRDTGTVIFPEAPVKFFLTASIEVRALRWLHDKKRIGTGLLLEQAMQELNIRDNRDSERKLAPLTSAPDALVIDATMLTIENVVEIMVGEIKKNPYNIRQEE